MTEKVTVIIPVYNVEKYVEESIRSIMKQTYNNLEILIVDDGSNDRSSEICEMLAHEDKRIQVFHKENGGQGSARNLALDRATGDYICFLDSDDSAKECYIMQLYEMIREHNIDIAVCNFELYDESGKLIKVKNRGTGYTEFTGREAIQSMWYQGPINIGPWVKLFKRDLWDGIRFRECFSEDFATMHKVFICAGKVGYSYNTGLNYLVRSNSSIRAFQDKKLIMAEIAADNMKFAIDYPELIPASKHKACSVYFHLLFQIPNVSQYKQVRDELKSNIIEIRREVLYDPNCVPKTKYALALSYLGFGVTKMVFNYVKKKDASF